MASSIDNYGYSPNSAGQAINTLRDQRGHIDLMGDTEERFLTMLITQLQNQDPMNPIKDQDFIAQLAQFTALEQTQNLAQVMEKFVANQERNELIGQATSLLGKEVVVINSDTNEVAQGLVGAVKFTDGVPQLYVNGKAYFLWEVQAIQTAS